MNGRLQEILEGKTIARSVNITGSSALAYTLAPGKVFKLTGFRIHLSAAGASGNLTATMDAKAGAAYDTVLYTQDMTSVTDLVYNFTVPLQFAAGDEIDFAWANAGAKTYGMTIFYEVYELET